MSDWHFWIAASLDWQSRIRIYMQHTCTHEYTGNFSMATLLPVKVNTHTIILFEADEPQA